MYLHVGYSNGIFIFNDGNVFCKAIHSIIDLQNQLTDFVLKEFEDSFSDSFPPTFKHEAYLSMLLAAPERS